MVHQGGVGKRCWRQGLGRNTSRDSKGAWLNGGDSETLRTGQPSVGSEVGQAKRRFKSWSTGALKEAGAISHSASVRLKASSAAPRGRTRVSAQGRGGGSGAGLVPWPGSRALPGPADSARGLGLCGDRDSAGTGTLRVPRSGAGGAGGIAARSTPARPRPGSALFLAGAVAI